MTREQYELVAAQRLQWDALLWQVPTLSLTGQAFLFAIALGDGSTRGARMIASLLALLLALVSMISLSRHRLSEISDARRLADYEQKHGMAVLHGPAFAEARKLVRQDLTAKGQGGRSESRLARLPDRIVYVLTAGRAYPVWLYTFAAFGVAAVVVFVLAATGSPWLR